MKKHPKPFLQHIIDASTKIEVFLKDCSYEEYLKDEKTQLAVIKLLEMIGEACRNFSKEFKSEYPQIPWEQIIAFRNRTTHEYWDINDETVWQIAVFDTPKLKQSLLPILQELESQENPSNSQ